MDARILTLAGILSACSAATVGVDGLDDVPGEGWADGPIAGWDTGDAAFDDGLPWDQARLRIQEPRSASVVPLGEVQAFRVALMSPDGPLPTSDVDIAWTSNQDMSWLGLGPTFEDDGLGVGIHTITAQATLPSGDVLAHSVGAVLVQTPWSGTYSGLYKVDVSVNNVPVPVACTGATTLIVGPYGDEGEGEGTCLISVLGMDIALTWVFKPEFDLDGNVSGKVGVSGFGLFTYDFPTTGEFRPNGDLRLEWEGDIPLLGSIEGYLTAPRVSILSF